MLLSINALTESACDRDHNYRFSSAVSQARLSIEPQQRTGALMAELFLGIKPSRRTIQELLTTSRHPAPGFKGRHRRQWRC